MAKKSLNSKPTIIKAAVPSGKVSAARGREFTLPKQFIPPALIDNFNFFLFGAGTKFPFRSYIPQTDPTASAPGVLVVGSQNVYVTMRGTIAPRPGMKLRGNQDATIAGTKSSYEWLTSNGATLPLRVNNGNFQVEFDAGDGAGLVWRSILTGLTLTRFVFDLWWDSSNKKDRCVFGIGDSTLRSWSGGVGVVASATSSTITLTGTTSVSAQGFDTGTNQLLINGIIYTYTGAGSSPIQTISFTPTNNKLTLSSTAWISQKFTTGASATQITTATTTVNDSAIAASSGVFVAGIYTDNAGVPGTLLGTAQATIPAGTTGGDSALTFTFDALTVSGATAYHLVLYLLTGPTTFSAYYGASGSVGTNTSSDGGQTWSASNGQLYCTVNENTVAPQTFTGVTPNPSAITANTVALQAVATSPSVPDAFFNIDFVRVVGNQVHCGSYSSRFVYISRNTNYQDFVVPTSRAPGDPDKLTLDSFAHGIAAQKDRNGQATVAVISGSLGDWYTVARAPLNVGTGTSVTLTEQVTVLKSQSEDLSSALGHEFITNIGDNLIYLDQNNQLREFGTARNIKDPVFPTLSLDLFDELRALDFTGGHLRSISSPGGTTVYLTCPLSGIDYMYQVRMQLDEVGNMVAQRLWQTPQTRSLSRIAVIGGKIYGHSNANPQLYQLWDTGQYHDDSPTGSALPYSAHATFSYLNEGRTNLLSFDKLFMEGYMTQGTFLNTNLFMEYEGSKNEPLIVINDPGTTGKHPKYYVATADVSVGESSLGDNPLGDGLQKTAQALVPKFRAIRTTPVLQVFEYSLDVFSEVADSQWELVCLGVNQTNVQVHPVAIRS